MPPLRRTRRLSTYIFGCLTAALLTTQLAAVDPVTINYTDGQTDAKGYDTSGANDPTTLSILSGTATQSGILTGTGQVIKVGAGTLILSGANDYSGSTTINAGTLQVVDGGAISHSGSSLTIGNISGDMATLILSGGSISNAFGNLGNNGSGTANVSGGTWTNTSYLFVGNLSTGVLNLSSGTVSNTNGYVGANASGTANVSGGEWTNSGSLTIGYFSTGVLNLSGGTVSSIGGIVGSNGSGTANVSGGTWTNTGDLTIGYFSTGVLNLSSGTVSNTDGYVGSNRSGTANVSGGEWTNAGFLYVGYFSNGVLNLSGGTVSNTSAFVGLNGSGTANVSGGTWTNTGDLTVGYFSTGVLNLSGGTVSNTSAFVGSNASGTANVSGGTWTNTGDLTVGNYSTGVLNLSGGTVSNTYGYVGYNANGTANVSGGTWTNTGELTIGNYSTGVLNLTDSGTVSVGNGTLYLARNSGSGTLNIGTGGLAGTLEADSVYGGSGTAVVNFNHTGSLNFTPSLDGSLSVNQIGPGTTTLTAANTYTGATSVLGGTLELRFGGVTTDILSSATSLYMGSGTLLLTGQGDQHLNGLSTTDNSAGSIVLGQNQTLDLGVLQTVGDYSALNFNLAAGGADGENLGNSEIVFGGPTANESLSPGFTVTDATGFGLATINDDNRVIRMVNTDLLPTSGTDSGTDYRIDNNDGGSTAAGSSSLIVTDSQSARSITVDTTAASGVLTLAENAVINTSVWNFGSAAGSSHAFEITGGANSGITTDVSGGFVQINNYNTAPVTISTSILETDHTGLMVGGPGTTILTATSNYTGNTLVTSGVLEVAENGSINNDPGSTTIGDQQGEHASLVISGGSVNDAYSTLGNTAGAFGTTTVSSGSWSSSAERRIGSNGTGVLNLTGGSVSNGTGYVGYGAGSSGTVNVSGGTWTNTDILYIGNSGTGVLNISSGSVTNTTGNTNNTNVYLGALAGSSGTANVSGGTWTNDGNFIIGNSGTGVLNVSGGSVTNAYAFMGVDGSGTANVSGGTWTNNRDLIVGYTSTAVLNLTDSGTVHVGDGTLYLASGSGSSGTLNIGTGGAAGTLEANHVSGGYGTAVVNFNHTDSLAFYATLDRSLTVNQIGTGTTTLTKANTYTGATNVLGGTLELQFAPVSANILPTTTDLTLGSGSLLLVGDGTQTVNSLSTRASSAASIVLSKGIITLDLGTLSSVGSHSALNFNTWVGGADGATVGTGIILLAGQTAGEAINSSFTVSDRGGFGLATVNASNQIIRLTTTDLLPATATDSGTDYLINNNAGGSSTPGSALLTVTENQTVRSITVDTTADSGVLTLGSGVVINSDVWNFGGTRKNTFEITGGDSGGGITSATASGTMQINNYSVRDILISAAIQNNGYNSVLFQGPGTTVLAGENSYPGDTTITSGVVEVAETGSISGSGTTTVGKQTGDNATLNILGSVFNLYGILGDATGAIGTANVSGSGSWNQKGDLTVGKSGTGVLNITDGGYAASDSGYIGANTGSSGTVTVSNGGSWDVNGDLFIGQNGTGVLNISERGGVSVNRGSVKLGAQGTLNIGTGGSIGDLDARTVTGVSGAVVNYNYNSLEKIKSSPPPLLTGDLAVNKLGSGFISFSQQNTYTGRTTVNGGRLSLNFKTILSNIISSQSALTLGGGSLQLNNGSGSSASQTLNGLTTTAGTGSHIYLGSNVTLDLGALTSAGIGSALNFATNVGGADGATVGTGIILLSGQTAGSVINQGFTVTDSTGFGLATVNDLNQIIRLTNTDLLPYSGAVAGMDYRIDNNAGDSLTPGSSSLEITASQTVRSITVDTTASSGLLTLDSGVVLSTDVWNFGSRYNSDYEITGSDSGAGLSTATKGGMLQINNYYQDGSGFVTISAPILDNAGSSLRVAGTGTTVLTGADTYTGETIINSGSLFINGDHTAATGTITVQSAAELGGIGTLGGDIHVQNGGFLTPGNTDSFGTLTGTNATFDTNSIFYVQGGGGSFSTLHLSGSATIAAGALIYLDVYDDLTLSSYTLMTADGGGLDSSSSFTLGSFKMPFGYSLVYDGNTLKLVSDTAATAPGVAYWTGKVDSNWSSLSSGSSNWATALDGQTDTAATPDAPTDVTFAAQSVIGGPTQANLDVDATINSLTIIRPTIIGSTSTHTLTVNTTTTVSSDFAIDSGVTLIGKGALTIDTSGTLTGNGSVEMAADQNIIANGAITVPAPQLINFFAPTPEVLSLTTSGTGAIVMGLDSTIHISLNTGAGLGDNTAIGTAAGVLNLHGTLDATAGGTLVLENPSAMTGFAGGDQWKVFELNSGAGSITGHLALNDSGIGLTTGFFGTFDQTTGIYSIADHRAQMTAESSGLPMANAESQSIISGSQTANNDVNNHLFNLRNGGGEEEESDGSIAASLDYGVVVGQGDGPEDKNPIAKRVKRSRQWEVFTTVNYGNVKLSPISSQSGVQIDSWASSVGIERHLSRSVIVGFAATFLQSTQTYTGSLGSLDLEGPTLSAYVSYVRKAFWSSFLYSFGDYDLGSHRNPGLGLPVAQGATNAYTNAIQYNTGWNFRFMNNTLVTGPFIGIDYLHGTLDAYTETGGGVGALAYGKQSFESLVTRIGWSTSKKIETTWATITPQLRLSYERQNIKNNGTSVQAINAPFSAAGGNQSPGQDYMVIGTGVSFQFTPEFNMQLGYQTQIFRNNLEAHFGSVRFGYKF